MFWFYVNDEMELSTAMTDDNDDRMMQSSFYIRIYCYDWHATSEEGVTGDLKNKHDTDITYRDKAGKYENI